MKLLVFGATGGTGKLVVEQALSKGVEVTAFVRNRAKLHTVHPQLKVVRGDVMELQSIQAVMKGHDAVVCCIGTPATQAGNTRSEGTKNIISAMQGRGVKRLICQTSLGVGDSEAILKNTPFLFKRVIVPFLLKKTFEDHARQENEVQQSGLIWTIVRPGSMTNAPATGKYHQGEHYNDRSWKVKISRRDVAQFIVNQLNSPVYNKKAVGISY